MIKVALVDNDRAFSFQIDGFIHRFMKEMNIDCEIVQYDNEIDFISDYLPIFDVIFINESLENLHGIDVAKRLRLIDEKIPIIFFADTAEAAIKGYEVNALDFIIKPVKYVSFIPKLKKLLAYFKILSS